LTLLVTVVPAMMTTAASAVEHQMQVMVVWRSLLGVISTLSTPSTRPPATPLKKNGLGRGWRCLKASPPKKAPKVLFQVHHRRRRSLLQLQLDDCDHRSDQGQGRDGGGLPPSLPKKNFTRHFDTSRCARQHKIHSPSKLAVLIQLL